MIVLPSPTPTSETSCGKHARIEQACGWMSVGSRKPGNQQGMSATGPRRAVVEVGLSMPMHAPLHACKHACVVQERHGQGGLGGTGPSRLTVSSKREMHEPGGGGEAIVALSCCCRLLLEPLAPPLALPLPCLPLPLSRPSSS